MPTTPIYALPYPAAADPADVPLDMQELAERIALVLGGALSATPPATPFEGQLWAMSPVAGVVWSFRYNAGSASAYKWEFIGGPSLYANVDANVTTASTAYVDLGGPAVTVPRAGEYEITFGSDLSNGPAASYARAAVKLGAAAAADTERIESYGDAIGNVVVGCARTMIRTLAAADVLKIWYRVTVAGGPGMSAQFSWLAARPVRVS